MVQNYYRMDFKSSLNINYFFQYFIILNLKINRKIELFKENKRKYIIVNA